MSAPEFPTNNASMKIFGIIAIVVGGGLLLFGGVIGSGFGHVRVMNLPMVIIGAVGLLSGVILYTAGSLVAGNLQLTAMAEPPSEATIAYDKGKWIALVKYDDEIALIADKLKPLGQKWVDEFASSYLSLNDKSYLPNLVHKIIVNAKKEDEEASLERKRKAAEDLAQKALEESVFIEQASKAPQQLKKWSVKDHASLWGGVLIVCAMIAYLFLSSPGKVLDQSDPAMHHDNKANNQSDSRPNDQIKLETQIAAMLQKVKASRRKELDGNLPEVERTAFHEEVSQFETTVGAPTIKGFTLRTKLDAPLNVSSWNCTFDEIAKLNAYNGFAGIGSILGDNYEWAAFCHSNGSSYVLAVANSQANDNAVLKFEKGSTVVFSGGVVAKEFQLILYDRARWYVIVTSFANK